MAKRLQDNKSFLYTTFFAIIICFFINMSNAYAENQPTASDNSYLTTIWKNRISEVTSLEGWVIEEESNANSIIEALAVNMNDLQAKYARSQSLYQDAYGHPAERVIISDQMSNLISQFKHAIQPIEIMSRTISEKVSDLANMQANAETIANLQQETALISNADAELIAMHNDYKRRFKTVSNRIHALQTRVTQTYEPAFKEQEKFISSIKATQDTLPDLWRNYYLNPADTTYDPTVIGETLINWTSSSMMRLALAYPDQWNGWKAVLKNFIIATVLIGLFGFVLAKGFARAPGNWKSGGLITIRRSWPFITIGCAFIAASSNPLGGSYQLFILLGVLILIFGVTRFSWKLRETASPKIIGHPSPLKRLFVPASIGVLILFSDLSPKILNIIWVLVMLIFLIVNHIRHKAKASSMTNTLEKLSNMSSYVFGILSLACAFIGYGRMAILLFMLLFAIINVLVLGSALSALGSLLSDKIFKVDTNPIKNTLSRALALPIAWLVSLLCTLPWLWAVPGARFIIDNFLSTNYTVGESSFDFLHVILIIVLFYIFRSFISLIKQSMNLLPKKLDNFEAGVIPPLQSITGYFLWGIYIIIALTLIGVNLMSLAVVAGGLSVGIGFGLQNIFNNLVSGIILIFGRTILVGDVVVISGTMGTVTEISMRSTTIRKSDKSLVFVPNSAIMTGEFINFTRNPNLLPRILSVFVEYETDIEKAKQVLIETAIDIPNVDPNSQPNVYMLNFTELGIELGIEITIINYSKVWSTLSLLRFAVDAAFKKNGIKMANRKGMLQNNEDLISIPK